MEHRVIREIEATSSCITQASYRLQKRPLNNSVANLLGLLE